MNIVGLMRALPKAAMLPALAFGVAALMPTGARAQTVEWSGFGFLSGFTEACAEIGYPVGGRIQVDTLFLPSGIGDNGTSSRLTFFERQYASSLVLSEGRFDNTWRRVQAGGLGADMEQWPRPTRVRARSQWPNNDTVNATTPHIRIVGGVRGVRGAADCDYSFDAVMILNP